MAEFVVFEDSVTCKCGGTVFVVATAKTRDMHCRATVCRCGVIVRCGTCKKDSKWTRRGRENPGDGKFYPACAKFEPPRCDGCHSTKHDGLTRAIETPAVVLLDSRDREIPVPGWSRNILLCDGCLADSAIVNA